MATFRTKKEVEAWLTSFAEHARYDENGGKWYSIFADEKRDGNWTLMQYPDGTWTRHGKGDTYCDEQEMILDEATLRSFVWTYRKAIASAAKDIQHAQ